MITKTQENLAILAIFASCKVIKKSEGSSQWKFGNNFLNSHSRQNSRDLSKSTIPSMIINLGDYRVKFPLLLLVLLLSLLLLLDQLYTYVTSRNILGLSYNLRTLSLLVKS